MGIYNRRNIQHNMRPGNLVRPTKRPQHSTIPLSRAKADDEASRGREEPIHGQ